MASNMPWSRYSELNSQFHPPQQSQPSQSIDSGRRQPTRTIDSTEKASWDPRTTEILIRVCVEEVQAGNRPGSHFNKNGWDNIKRKFAALTTRNYTRLQLKNRWDTLKKEWGHWQTLLRGSTGLGWNNEKGTVRASEEWWAEKIVAHPEVAKFKERGPLLVDEQEILFSDVVATGGSAWTPSSGLLPPHLQDEQDDEDHENYSQFNGHDSDPIIQPGQTQQTAVEGCSSRTNLMRNTQFPAQISHKKHKKLTSAEKIARSLDRMAKNIESESASTRASTGNTRQFTIQECMEMLDRMSGVPEGSKLWMYATQLFLKPAIRELFLSIKRDETRVMWLEEQMKVDMLRRSSAMTSVHASGGGSHHADNASSG